MDSAILEIENFLERNMKKSVLVALIIQTALTYFPHSSSFAGEFAKNIFFHGRFYKKRVRTAVKHHGSNKYFSYPMFITIVVLIFSSLPCFTDSASSETEFFEWANSIPIFHNELALMEEEAFVTRNQVVWVQDFGRLRAMTGRFLSSVTKMVAVCEKDRAKYGKIYPRYFEVLSKYQSALKEMASNFHQISCQLGKKSEELNYSFEGYTDDLKSYSNLRADYRELRRLINTLPVFICPWIWNTSLFHWIDHFQHVESEWVSLESEWIATERRTSFMWDNVMAVGMQDFRKLRDMAADLAILVERMRLIDENDMRISDKRRTNYFVVSSQYLFSLEQVIFELFRMISELEKKSKDVTYYSWEQHIEDMTSYNKVKDNKLRAGELMHIIYQQNYLDRKLKLKK